ncbi:uncharacterized protein L201_005298 [Kwoniella dendrophila CBS 6074]|uniref:EF-hand domain-containing protein n=1 Tax=Kwoniella dendrophila CBS 6074 TaxID=1295534 RepID=A0AAX4K0Q6_9TREE
MKKVKTAPPINYAKLIPPLKDWHKLEEVHNQWLEKCGGNGAIARSIKLKATKGLFDLMPMEIPEEDREKIADELFRNIKLGLTRSPNRDLVTPKISDFRYGYSWVAWKRAAEYAGAIKLNDNFTQICKMVKTSCEYAANTIRRWREDPSFFAEFCNQLRGTDKIYPPLSDDQPDHQEDNDRLSGVTFAIQLTISNAHELLIKWTNLLDRLNDLKQLGLDDDWEIANKQVKIKGLFKENYREARQTLHLTSMFQQMELQFCFAQGRGKEYVVETSKWREEEESCDLEFAGQSNFQLKMTYEKLRNISYVDFLLASLYQFRDINGNTPSRDFAHYFLEFEQAVMADPSISEVVSSYVQNLIGERAMSHEMTSAMNRFFFQNMSVDPVEGYSVSEKQKAKSQCHSYEIFGYRIPSLLKAAIEQHMTPELARFVWEEFDSIAMQKHGDSVGNLLGIAEFLQTPKPGWITQKVELEDTCFPVTDTPLSISDIQHEKEEAITELDTDQTSQPFKVNNKQMKLVRKLFSKAEEEDGRGQVKWDDIYKLMKRIGFRIDEAGGSIVKFVPPNEAGIPFVEHRPHPENNIGSIRYRAFGKGLTERYGWTREWFERVIKEE